MAENLIGAAMRNDLASVDRLLVHGVPASIVRGSLWDGFMTPLIAAAMRGNHKVVEKLLHAGAEVNTCHCSTSEYCSVDQGYITMT
jgi:ankyrin repeat protein